MTVKERLKALRELMKEKNIDGYIIPSDDYHQSEYVGDYFKCRQFISGFTGSAGTVVFTKDEAGLWTDGRYFIQAEKQLDKSGIKLFKMGEENVKTPEEYLYSKLEENSVLGFDGKVISSKEGLSLKNKLAQKNIKISYNYDLIGEIWSERPELSKEKAFLLQERYAGVTFREKLDKVRKFMKEKKATVHILASLDDIAWLFNIRGRDVKYNPVVLSYAVITLDEVYLFVNKDKLNDEILKELHGVKIKDYFEIYDFVKKIDSNEKVLVDEAKVNYSIYNDIPKEVEKIDEMNPTTIFKAVKNEVELQNLRNCHLRDGVAFTKFMYWLKNNVSKQTITEMSASDKAESFRKEQEGYIEPSFGTIAAYKDHAAMMHYSATEKTDVKLNPEHLFLIDSGAQYNDGTTDITRTIALGKLNDELKHHFTLVLKGMLNLSMAKFLYGISGINLDILARRPMWNIGIDYKCGTGHGVGFLLNVHEGPHGIRWRNLPEKREASIIEDGMIVTNEPGIYIEGSHGIRTENELIVKKYKKTEFGQFMEFETLTCVPIDLDAVDEKLLSSEEKEWLNTYHKWVYKKVSPYLEEEEKEWLKHYTREI